MYGGASASHIGFVHHVIMQQCEVVKHLNCYRLVYGGHRFFTHSLACGKGKHRTESFASAVESVSYRVIQSGRLFRQTQVGYSVFDYLQIF